MHPKRHQPFKNTLGSRGASGSRASGISYAHAWFEYRCVPGAKKQIRWTHERLNRVERKSVQRAVR
jgi:hypothetical protein